MNNTPLLKSWVDACRIWSDLGWRYSEMMLSSAQVIAHRSDRMRTAGANPNALDRAEFFLMKQEKVDAAVESSRMMGMETMLASQRFAAFAFGQFFKGLPAYMALALPGTYKQVSGRQLAVVRNALESTALSANKVSVASGRIAQRGLTPVRKRATDNARRLSKGRAK